MTKYAVCPQTRAEGGHFGCCRCFRYEPFSNYGRRDVADQGVIAMALKARSGPRPHFRFTGGAGRWPCPSLHRITGIAALWRHRALRDLARRPCFRALRPSIRSSGSSVRRSAYLILFGYTWILLHHMLGGVRHLVWDFGYGMEAAPTRINMSRFTLIGSTTLPSQVWAIAFPDVLRRKSHGR